MTERMVTVRNSISYRYGIYERRKKQMIKPVGEICRERRLKTGVTVREIAKMTNYTIWNIYKFEEGRHNSLTLVLFYINELGLDPGVLK